jgi:hypothetical protein
MTQALYAHMNNKTKNKQTKKKMTLFIFLFLLDTAVHTGRPRYLGG